MSNAAAISSRKLALACADFLWRQDATLQSLGLERLSIEVGQAAVAMIVLPSMVNGLGITHGGAIFTLADFSICVSLQCLQRTDHFRPLQHFVFATNETLATVWSRWRRKSCVPDDPASMTSGLPWKIP